MSLLLLVVVVVAVVLDGCVGRTRRMNTFPTLLNWCFDYHIRQSSATPFLVTLLRRVRRNLSVTWSTMVPTCSELEFGTMPNRS
jgi:hypothetical protein